MKKLMMLIIAAAMLAACSNEEKNEPAAEQQQDAVKDQAEVGMEEGMEEGLKAGTVEQDYAALSQDEVTVNSKVKFIGTVTAYEDGKMEVQGESADEIVRVDDIRISERTEIVEGTEVIVYGSYNGKNDDGVPVIKGIFIDAD
ncbi:hypothetical protein [Sporosarcina cascadiensis]|uniref:hypothetical protein n=1 Tax=Sporosarcina cascadiensis TaxID=2660747 RepID=UPI00129B6964|nr:hypothetical protein [Sporosarcina cascadiensis]